MNPETKIILDELNKRFTEHNAKWDFRFNEQESHILRHIQELEQAQDARMSALEKVVASFDEWRPSIEDIVDDIQHSVDKSKMEVSKISHNLECVILDQPAPMLGVLVASPAAAIERSPTR
jgi:hypothetical protein